MTAIRYHVSNPTYCTLTLALKAHIQDVSTSISLPTSTNTSPPSISKLSSSSLSTAPSLSTALSVPSSSLPSSMLQVTVDASFAPETSEDNREENRKTLKPRVSGELIHLDKREKEQEEEDEEESMLVDVDENEKPHFSTSTSNTSKISSASNTPLSISNTTANTSTSESSTSENATSTSSAGQLQLTTSNGITITNSTATQTSHDIPETFVVRFIADSACPDFLFLESKVKASLMPVNVCVCVHVCKCIYWIRVQVNSFLLTLSFISLLLLNFHSSCRGCNRWTHCWNQP